jgi:membrane protein required for colicin V production
MAAIDAAVAALLGLFALRGFWRGFFRESFGLAALVVGILAAVRWTAAGDAALQPYLKLPAPLPAGVAFVAIFTAVHTLINVIGVLLDWAAGAPTLRWVSGMAGAAFGAGKGAALLGLLLLFLHLFPIAGGGVDAQIMRSSLGRQLVAGASAFLRLGLKTGLEPPQGSGQT